MEDLNILFLSDTHLGFDTPGRPRVKKRRRGPDFFANYHRALKPAHDGEVDLVVHGGDMFYRADLPAGLVAMAFEPLKILADKGVPVYIVPGNHERSQIPYPLLTLHPNIHIFDRPRTFVFEKNNIRLALSGFPHVRRDIRRHFPDMLEQTGWRETEADVRLLCLHHCIEGAMVGPGNYRFTSHSDVVRCADLPEAFAAYLAGHIHRFQVIEEDLAGAPLAAPMLYPGSTERTSFAEKDEQKGYLTFRVTAGQREGGQLTQWTFHKLPARAMIQQDLNVGDKTGVMLKTSIWQALASLPKDCVVRLRLFGQLGEEGVQACNAVKALAPETMNLDFRFPRAG